MSSSNPITPSPFGEFQAHFGTPPGTQDVKDDCAKWERLCAELLAEREKLRAELDKERAQHAACEKLFLAHLCQDCKMDFTMEELYAQVDRENSMEQLIAELA